MELAKAEGSDLRIADCSNLISSSTSPPGRNVFLVSTLDGKMTALDPDNGGQVLWVADTGTALLSASLESLVLDDGRGGKIRFIPSLDGGLYRYDGNRVEAVVSADFLLKNSFKTEDLLFTGGRETKMVGINARTGEVNYVCTMDGGCNNFTTDNGDDDVIIVGRHTHTVRAIEPRSGREKWQFSVGEHDVKYIESVPACSQANKVDIVDENEVKLLVCKGVVSSLNRVTKEMNWSHEFGSPVVNAWQVKNGQLYQMDLFDPNNLLDMERPEDQGHLLFYVGRHLQQLYVQQTQTMQRRLQLSDLNTGDFLPVTEYSAAEVKQIFPSLNDVEDPETALVPVSTQMLFEEDGDDMGFYFWQEEKECTPPGLLPIEDTCCLHRTSRQVLPYIPGENRTQQQYYIGNVFFTATQFYGLVVSATIVLFIGTHVMLSKILRQFNLPPPNLPMLVEDVRTESIPSTTNVSTKTLTPSDEDHNTFESQVSRESRESQQSSSSFTSRYLTDFEPVRCLGKGGFGIVFESRNRIDDCSYAVKRIRLPHKEEAREKVLREVKALAKLDHSHIVRYYNAWLEVPPVDWQEEQDLQWKTTMPVSCTDALSVETGAVTESMFPSAQASVVNHSFNPFRPFDDVFSADQSLNGSCNDASIGEPYNSVEDSVVFRSNSGSFLMSPNDSISAVTRRHLNGSGDGAEAKKEDEEETKPKRPSSLTFSVPAGTVYLYIQMQLCKKESLKDWLLARRTIDDRGHDQVLEIFHQITSAVEYVHDSGLIHRDLKPSNIFFSMDNVVKVGDFGLVTGADTTVTTPVSNNRTIMGLDDFNEFEPLTDKVGTQLYMSPEQVAGNKYNQKVDIFSLGLILFELLWALETQMERVRTLSDLRKLKFPKAFKKSYSEEYHLIRRMLASDPSTRPAAADVKKHNLFLEFKEEHRSRRRTTSTRLSSCSQDSRETN